MFDFIKSTFKEFCYDVLYLFGKKKSIILLLGLDNSGKTTLMNQLKNNSLKQSPPTWHPTNEELIFEGVRIIARDMGGHEAGRRLWSDYFRGVDAIIFIIDAADLNRFSESKGVFESLTSEELLHKIPIIVLANKIDRIGAASEAEIRKYFAIQSSEFRGHDERPVDLFMCSIKMRQGYSQAFRKLLDYI